MDALRVFTTLAFASLAALLLLTFRHLSSTTQSAGVVDAAARIDTLEAEATSARSQIAALKTDVAREAALKTAAVAALREFTTDVDASEAATLDVESLRAENGRLLAENEGLRAENGRLLAENEGLRADAATQEAASVTLRASLDDERNARAAADAARASADARVVAAGTAASSVGETAGDAAERARNVAEARAQVFTLISVLGDARGRIATLEGVVKEVRDENDALRRAADEHAQMGAELSRAELSPTSSSESGDAREWKGTMQPDASSLSRADADAKVSLNASARKPVVSPFSNRSSFYASPSGGAAAASKGSFTSSLRI